MKVLIDTNVLLDVLCARKDYLKSSLEVWEYCEDGRLQGCISALSIPNIVYILRKELNPVKTKEIIDVLISLFEVVEIRKDDLLRAAAMKFDDFEDAVQVVCAEKIAADYIVTRNIRDFTESQIPAEKPDKLLDIIKEYK